MADPELMVHVSTDTPDASYMDGLARRQHLLLKMTRGNIQNAWREDDQLLVKFFPIPVEPKYAPAYAKARKERYNERIGRKRWIRIPPTPKSVAELYTPLTELFNHILFLCDISRFRRLFLNTHGRHEKQSYKLRPGIVLSGIGAEFATSGAPVPRAVPDSLISAFEIVLESDDLTRARDRLVVHMHFIFQSQDNRRFAFGIIATQDTFTVYMFDHSGAVASKPFNYHENPEQLFSVILGLAGDGASIGFDTTMCKEPDCTTVYTLDLGNGKSRMKTYYKLESRLFRFKFLVGRGTMCWIASPLEDPTERLVIKDAWIAEDALAGRESEGVLLRHAQRMGVTLGLAQVHHAGDVLLGTEPLYLDTVGRNRGALGERNIDRVHSRIVMKSLGKTLDKFGTRHELILAFHDAVLAHRNLYQVAGILHRDISPHNILINPEGVEGDRGILIDLDHAIRIDDTSPYSTKGKIGTWRYRSRNVLDEAEPHTYIDDLESFFYVLLRIVSVYERPRVVTPKIPVTVSMWDDLGASTAKYGLFAIGTKLTLQPWFGRCFHNLVLRLLKFVKSRRPLYDLPPPAPDPEKDYLEFLGHIRQCIVELVAEEGQSTQDAFTEDGPADPVIPQKASSAPRRGLRAQTLIPGVKAYPKRSTANYQTSK